MTNSPAKRFHIGYGLVDTKKVIDEESYYDQGHGQPAWLTSKLIYMMGMDRRSFPMATRLLGAPYFDMEALKQVGKDEESPYAMTGIVKTIEAGKTEFVYPRMTAVKRGSEILKTPYVDGDKPGIGNQPFTVLFKDNALHKWYFVQSPRGIICFVVKEPEPKGDYFEYTFRFSGRQNQFCPLSELQGNVRWINLFPAVAETESRNIDIARAITPAAGKNQMTTLRLGLTYQGDVANLKSKYIYFTDRDPVGDMNNKDKDNKTRWMDQYMYNFEVDNYEAIEMAIWKQRYNREENGQILHKDSFTGRPIIVGSGIEEQILHRIQYSNFTYKLLSEAIGRGYQGVRGTPKTKTLYTGTLGMQKFDEAMKLKSIEFLRDFGQIADKFVTGSDYGLMLGGYFDGFYHIDGWIIKVKKVDLFDNGLISSSPIDEETGYSYESGKMVLLDDSPVDGEPNLQLLLGEGFTPFKHAMLRGFNDIPQSLREAFKGGNNTGNLNSSDIQMVMDEQDKSTYMRMYKLGVQLLRGNTSFIFEYAPTLWN